MSNLKVISKLQDKTDATCLVESHQQVIQHYSDSYTKKENLLHFGRGKIYTNGELANYAKAGKKPIQIPIHKDSMRAYIGAMLQNPPKITFSPVEPSDQAIVDPLKFRLQWELHNLEASNKAIELIETAWLTGSAYQCLFSFEIEGEKKPIIGLTNENSLAVYWDPNSSDLGRRDDAMYVDRDKYLSIEDLEDNFEELAKAGEFKKLESEMEGDYEAITKYADRAHEIQDQRNGLFKVTERYYRVTKKEHFAVSDDGESKIEDAEVESYKSENPDIHIERRSVEYLYVAIICPVWSRTRFLYNGPYHCQKRHPRTKKILWPIKELVCERLPGEAMGYAEDLMDMVKTANALISELFHSARTNSGSGTFFNPKAFLNDKVAKDYEKNGSDSSRHFPIRDGIPFNTVAGPIAKGTMPKEVVDVLNILLPMIEKVSSTPEAMKGITETGQVSGKLMQQRVTQAYIQQMQARANYADYCKRIAEDLLAHWVVYNDKYTNENIRLLSKNNADDPDWITFNEVTEAPRDEFGILQNRLQKLNDPTTVQYDVIIEDPSVDPSQRQAQIDTLMELLNVPAVQADPLMTAGIAFEVITLLDIPIEIKGSLLKNSSFLKAKEQEKQAMEQAQAQTELASQQAQVQGQQLDNAAQAQAINQQAQMPPEVPPMRAAA